MLRPQATVQPTTPHKSQQKMDQYLRPSSSPQDGTAHIVTGIVVSSGNPVGGTICTATTATPQALPSQAGAAVPIVRSSRRRIIIDDDDDDVPASVPTHDAAAATPRALTSPARAAHPSPAAATVARASGDNGSNASQGGVIIVDDDNDDNDVPASVPTHDATAAAPQALAFPARAAHPSHTADTVASASGDEDSDDNFAVVMQPVRTAPTTARPAVTAHPSAAPKRRRRSRCASDTSTTASKATARPPRSQSRAANVAKAPELVTGSDLDEKQQYEDEAEESDADFIDDDEPDESSEDAAQQVRHACAALRNRSSWQSQLSPCPMCADLQTVLRSLLGLD